MQSMKSIKSTKKGPRSARFEGALQPGGVIKACMGVLLTSMGAGRLQPRGCDNNTQGCSADINGCR